MANSTPAQLQMLSERYYLKDLMLACFIFFPPRTCLENESGFAAEETVVCKIIVSFVVEIGSVS